MTAGIELTIDCRDLETTSRFWTALLDYDDAEQMDGTYSAASEPDGKGPRLVFQRVDGISEGKSPVHLDLHVDDLDLWADRVTSLGGSRVDREPIIEAGSTWIRCEDPEGIVFCLVLSRQ